jgi:hypothetical protein
VGRHGRAGRRDGRGTVRLEAAGGRTHAVDPGVVLRRHDLYTVVEQAQFVLVVCSIVAAGALVAVAGSITEVPEVSRGALAIGRLPADADIALLLGGIAFAGAGGYLNLSQSLWARENGYGMGKFQGRLRNPFRGDESEPVHRDGFAFPATIANLRRWRARWRVVQLEDLLTFVLGLLVAGTLAITVVSAVAPDADATGLALWFEAVVPELGGIGRLLVYVLLFVALFTTEYAILESFVRNSADAVDELYGREAGWDQSRLFLGLLTAFVGWGGLIILLPFEEPFVLLVIGAAMSGVMMWPYTLLTLVVNTTRLPVHLRPGWGRIVALWWSSAFLGYFSVLLVGQTLATDFGVTAFAVRPGIVGSNPAGYAVWAVFLSCQLYCMYRSAKGRLAGPVPPHVRGLLP